ncbi:ATP-binding protein [Thalassotalea sp. SU-HH00458]|uniref:ATP-binding protein n=1 Tax=Thalassotalea sp. SU-HH00458 TaxID=3127657 RepID=UPI003101F195
MKLPDTAIKAIYIDAKEKSYRGNPFIEALPPINSQVKLKEYLTRDTCEEFLPDEDDDLTRFHKIVSLIDGWFQPLSNHILLEQKLSLIIRKGYVGRNIATGDLNRILQKGYENIQAGGEMVQFGNNQSTAQSTLFIGGSGLGKTSGLNLLLASYPQIIFHPKYNHVQLTYLKVNCPHDGSLNVLCSNVLEELDRVLGTNYQSNLRQGWSIARRAAYIAQTVSKYSTGVLVIDEIQNLLLAKGGGKERILSFLSTLVDVINLPVLFVGTPKAKEIMMKLFMYARRCTGVGSIEWGPLKTSVQNTSNKKNKSEWRAFTDRLWKKQFLHEATDDLTDDIRVTWHDCTQGIIDIVIKLFVFTQIRAIVTKKERITSRLMRKVYEDEFRPIHPMIDALRSGDPDRITEYSDLYMGNTINFLTEKEKLFRKMEEERKKKARKFSGNKLALELNEFLLDLGVDGNEAQTIVKMVINDHPDKVEVKELVRIALSYQAEKKHVNAKSKKTTVKALPEKMWKSLDGKDLRFIHATNTCDIHGELEEHELIYKFA